MKLFQIPFSHNCVKVRIGLALKKLDYGLESIDPMNREPVREVSGQRLVPVLLDGDRAIADSTAILLYLDERYPDPPLLPSDPRLRAACLVLEDWADLALMAVTRRIAYWNVTERPGSLGRMFFPGDFGLARKLKERMAVKRVRERFRISAEGYRRDVPEARSAAALAVARLGGRPWLQDAGPTIADVALAAMSAPLAADPGLREDPAVAALLAWGAALVPPEIREMYLRV